MSTFLSLFLGNSPDGMSDTLKHALTVGTYYGLESVHGFVYGIGFRDFVTPASSKGIVLMWRMGADQLYFLEVSQAELPSWRSSKHRKDCEQQQNIQTTLKFFSIAVEYLNPDLSFLGHEEEINVAEVSDSNFSDFLFPLTYISGARFKKKGVKSSQVRSPIIKTKNGIILNNFSSIFEFEGEDEFNKRKEHDAELLGLQDIEMELW